MTTTYTIESKVRKQIISRMSSGILCRRLEACISMLVSGLRTRVVDFVYTLAQGYGSVMRPVNFAGYGHMM